MKNVLKFIGITIFIVFLSFPSKSQQNGLDYYDYVEQMDLFYDSIIINTPDTLKIPGWRAYQRWKDFWRFRVHNDEYKTGSLQEYSSQLIAAHNDYKDNTASNTAFDWYMASPASMTTHNKGIIVSLWIDPDNINIVFAGGNTCGIFATTDGGLTWNNVTDNIGIPAIGVNDIAVHPTNKDIKYIAASISHHDYLATRQPAFVYKTEDNCASWTEVLSFLPSENVKLNRIVMDPQDPQVLYALVKGKVYRTMNGGGSWEIIFDQLGYAPGFWNTNKHLLDIEFKPNDPNTIYISSNGIGPTEFDEILTAEIWVTHNAKAPENDIIWNRIVNGIDSFTDRIGIETDPQNPDLLYILYTIGMPNNQAKTILKKAIFPNYQAQLVFEKTWSPIYSQPFGGTGYWCMNLEVSPVDPEIIYIGGWNLQTLNMNTGTFDFFGVLAAPHPTFHVDQRVFKTVQSGDSAFLFCGNDGGVSRYDCKNKIMTSLNGTGLDNHQFYGIGYSPVIPDFYIGGTQDNHVIGNGDNTWNIGQVGDAYDVIIDPFEPNIVYCTSNGGRKSVNISTNSGKKFDPINGEYPHHIPASILKDKGLNDRPLKLSPFDRNTLFVAYDEVYKTINSGLHWQKITNFTTTYQVTDAIAAIGITKASESTMYIGYSSPTWGGYLTSSRLFVTHNSGQSWDDITDGIRNVVRWTTITDIHVSPENKNHVWVSFGNYWENNGNAVNRIWFSEDGGQNWSDISYNLPNLPVNCLNGINLNLRHRILLGNDIGIFMFDELSNTWEIISNGVPNALIYDIEVNHEGRKILAATYGRGIWVTDIPCDQDQEVYDIQGDKTFYGDHLITGDLQIKAGSNVTIFGKLMLASNVKMIVEQDAIVKIDGGILTDLCSLPWRGIEVWGDPNLSHIPPSNQGWVQVINGGVIENAVCGIRTSKTELQNGEFVDVYGYSGGIVQANEAVFLNNRTAVKFFEYSFDNLSYFQNCDFITDNELPDGSSPEYFINLEGVKNVDIRACTFSNTTNGDVNDPERGGGIFAVNADILVSSSCKYPGTLPIGEPCPEEYFFASEFSGLYHGVYGLGTGQNRKVKVDQNVFNNNFRGLFISALHNSTVTRNTFDVYREQPVQNPESFGFRIEDADGYQIEENHFTGFDDNGVRYGVGLLIENSGSNPNMVYNNLFENLHLATLAVGMNRNQYNNEGLCYKCNDFVNNNFDIRVSGQRTEGIALHQGANLPGNNKAPAGNVFSSAPVNSNFFNGTVNEITYHRHQDPQEIKLSPYPYHGPLDVIHVLQTEYSKVNSCPSNLDGSGSPIEEQKMMEAGQQADSTYTELALLVDEGDTDAMNMEVQATTQATANDTYDQLVQTSPYLSDTVLKTTIVKEDVLTNPMIRDVMVANPQSAKSEVILDMLEAKSDPMPEGMMADIYDGKLILGGRELLEAEAAHYSRERYRAFSNLFRLYYADTLDLDAYDNLLALLAAEAEPTARYKLAFLHLDNNEPALAGQTLAAIPLAFNLDDNALDIHQAYLDLTDIWLQIMDNPVYFSAPDTGIINDLMALYNAGLGLPSVFARNILLASGLVEYEPIVSLTEPLKRDRFYRRDAYVQEEANLYLKLYPNPTSGSLTLEYKVDEGTKYAGLVFTDMQAISQRSESLSLSGGIKHLTVKDLKPGVYMVSLFLDNKQVAVQRLTIAY